MENENFKTEIFRLCDKLNKSEKTEYISEVIRNIPNDFKYMVNKQEKIQFYNYLFLDENVENIYHLNNKERESIENAHYTMLNFINMCTDEIIKKFPIIGRVINPYYAYKNINYKNKNKELLLNKEDFLIAVESFKQGDLYKKIINCEFGKIIENMGDKTIEEIMFKLDEEITDIALEHKTQDLENILIKLYGEINKIEDFIIMYMMLVYALKISLGIACQIMYKAICGDKIVILNNNNIIDIKEHKENICFETLNVIVQDALPDIIGDLVNIRCKNKNEFEIKKYGFVMKETVKYSAEFGNITNLKFVAIDDTLNYIKNTTDKILELEFLDLVEILEK